MRVALDATYSIDPYPSGIAVYSRELLQELEAAHPEDKFIRCFRPKQYFSASTGKRRLLIPPLPTFRADIFHALNQRVDRRSARAVISTFHDLFVMTNEYSSADFRRRFTTQAKRAAQNSDLIIAVSEFTAQQVVSLLGVARSRIRVIHHGVRIPPRLEEEHQREKMILFVGALQLRKNIARLVEAFEQVPVDWTLTLAGAPVGFGIENILQSIEISSARERIRITGYLPSEELEKLYARASIFAFPSLDEGFGMPVLEAMARGVPVVTSDSSALPEVAGDAALLVDALDTNAIAGALNQLIQDPDLYRIYAEKGRARARNFTWERAAAQTYDVYRELTSARLR